jgi:hypothetical protein
VQPDQPANLNYTAADGSSVTVQIPAGAADKPITLLYNEQTTPSQPTSGAFQVAGHTFTLTAYHDNRTVAGLTFLQPVIVFLTYTDADVVGLDESQLMLFYYDTATAQWSQEGIGVLERDLANNRLTVQIMHLTEFALGTANESLYLPLVQQN